MKAKNLPGMDAIKSSNRPNEEANNMNVSELNHRIYLASLGNGVAPTIIFSDGAEAEYIEFKRDKMGDMMARVIGINRFIHVSDDMRLDIHAKTKA